MLVTKPQTFGTVEVATAAVVAGGIFLHLGLRNGVVDKRELSSLIQFLNGKLAQLQ